MPKALTNNQPNTNGQPKSNVIKGLLAELTKLHNYLYANEGLSKEAIFKDISKILAIKLYAERKNYELLPSNSGRDLASENSSENLTTKLENFHKIATELSRVLKIPEFSSFTLSPRSLATALETFDNFRLKELKTDFLSDAYQTFFSHYHRGARGEFHTPYPVVELAVKLARPRLSERVIDPAAGAGGFLVAIARNLKASRENEGTPGWSIEEYIQNMLYAVEINPDIAFFLRIRFFIEFGIGPNVTSGNGLIFALENEGRFDIVITNPPFGAKGKVDDPLILKHYDLAKKWKKVSERWVVDQEKPSKPQPPEVLFLEASVRLLKPGGRLVIVVPDGILQNSQTEHIRSWLKERARLRAVVSLPNITFVPYGTGVKTSLLMLEKKRSEEVFEAAQKVFFAISSNVGFDRRGKPIPGSDLEQIADNFEKLTQTVAEEDAAKIGQSAPCFLVETNAICERWDAEYYVPRQAQTGLGDVRLPLPNLHVHKTEDLRVLKLGEIAVFKEEKSSIKRLNPDEEVQYVEISSILPGISLIGREVKIMRAKDLPSRATYIIDAGDILLAIAGASTGTKKQAVAWVTEEYDGAVCTSGFAVLRPISEIVNPYFLISYFHSEMFLRELKRILKGHAIPAASLSDVKEIPIYLPPRSTQDLIGKQIQDALESIRKGIRLLNELTRSGPIITPMISSRRS